VATSMVGISRDPMAIAHVTPKILSKAFDPARDFMSLFLGTTQERAIPAFAEKARGVQGDGR
jgi:hypothetical protein